MAKKTYVLRVYCNRRVNPSSALLVTEEKVRRRQLSAELVYIGQVFENDTYTPITISATEVHKRWPIKKL